MTKTQSGSGQPAIYNASAPTLTDGQNSGLEVDVSGNLKATLATKIAGEDLTNDVLKVEQRFSYANITATGTTTVKSGAGFLHNISINTKGGAANTFTLYDNTTATGTKIGTMDTTAQVGPQGPTDVSFATGLTIVSATATGADATVSYR